MRAIWAKSRHTAKARRVPSRHRPGEGRSMQLHTLAIAPRMNKGSEIAVCARAKTAKRSGSKMAGSGVRPEKRAHRPQTATEGGINMDMTCTV